MKHWLGLVALICFGSTSVQASPYFRIFNPSNIYKSVGAYIDPKDTGQSSFGTAVALVTHSTKDGCFLPSVVCEDWSPLMAGLSYNAGRFQFNFGPAANLAPLTQAGLLGVVNGLSRDDQFLGLKAALAPSDSPLSIAFGPALNIVPVDHGVILPFSAWAPKFRVFAGAALQF